MNGVGKPGVPVPSYQIVLLHEDTELNSAYVRETMSTKDPVNRRLLPRTALIHPLKSLLGSVLSPLKEI